jgi:hypothetical protein
MGTIAKWLVFRMAATAQADNATPGKTERRALRIDDFEVAFHADVAVVVDGDFCRGHSVSGPRAAAHCK